MGLDPLYGGVLSGQLVSAAPPPPRPRSSTTDPTPAQSILITYGLKAGGAIIRSVEADGTWRQIANVDTKNVSASVPVYPGQILAVTDSITGAFIAAVKIDNQTGYTIDDSVLCRPNQIGGPPEPNFDGGLFVPADSARVLVGVALVSKNFAWRYQYWRRSETSYELADGEKRTIMTSLTVGRTESSSSLETVAKSVNVSASGGWGPVSASIGAALSSTSTTSHSLTVSETTTRVVTDDLNNATGKDIYVLHWQMIDAVFIPDGPPDKDGTPVKVLLESAMAPLVARTYIMPWPSRSALLQTRP